VFRKCFGCFGAAESNWYAREYHTLHQWECVVPDAVGSKKKLNHESLSSFDRCSDDVKTRFLLLALCVQIFGVHRNMASRSFGSDGVHLHGPDRLRRRACRVAYAVVGRDYEVDTGVV